MMQESTLRALQNLRPHIRQRWKALLRTEPITSPLGHPDTLAFLMDWTLDRFFEALNKSTSRRRTTQLRGTRSCSSTEQICPCQMNPLLAYFKTAEIAIIESTLTLLQPTERDLYLAEVVNALQGVAKREIETFCAVCQRRPETEPHAHAHTTENPSS